MWVLFWKKYPLSKFATFVSIVGALTRYAGVMCLFAAAIPAALICIAIGIGIHFCAEGIAKSKAAKVARKANAAKPAATKETTKQPAAKPVETKPVEAKPVEVKPAPAAAAQPATSEETVKCSKCGADVPAANQFCSDCGSKMVKEKKCLRCGNILEEDDKFCGQCGYETK